MFFCVFDWQSFGQNILTHNSIALCCSGWTWSWLLRVGVTQRNLLSEPRDRHPRGSLRTHASWPLCRTKLRTYWMRFRRHGHSACFL